MAETFSPPKLDPTRSYDLDTISSASIILDAQSANFNVHFRIIVTTNSPDEISDLVKTTSSYLALIDSTDLSMEFDDYFVTMAIGLSLPRKCRLKLPSLLESQVISNASKLTEANVFPTGIFMLVWSDSDDALSSTLATPNAHGTSTSISKIQVYCHQFTSTDELKMYNWITTTPSLLLPVSTDGMSTIFFNELKETFDSIPVLNIHRKVLEPNANGAQPAQREATSTLGSYFRSVLAITLFVYYLSNTGENDYSDYRYYSSVIITKCKAHANYDTPTLGECVSQLLTKHNSIVIEQLLLLIFRLHTHSQRDEILSHAHKTCLLTTECLFRPFYYSSASPSGDFKLSRQIRWIISKDINTGCNSFFTKKFTF